MIRGFVVPCTFVDALSMFNKAVVRNVEGVLC